MDNTKKRTSNQQIQQPVQPVIQPVPQVPPAQSLDKAQPVVQPAAPVQPVQQPVNPGGSVYKEHGPIGEAKVSEFLTPSETLPNLEKSVEQAGVEVKRDVPELTLQDKKAGLALAKEAVPVVATPSGIVNLPIKPQLAMQILKKNKDTSNSIFGLASLVLKIVKREAVVDKKLAPTNVTL